MTWCAQHLDHLLPSLSLQESSSAASFHKDVASHFILRLAYCRSAELRNWLLTLESQMFKHRLRELSLDEQVCGAKVEQWQRSSCATTAAAAAAAAAAAVALP
jgi:hypothetical protein